MYHSVIVYAGNYRREHVMNTADSVFVYVIYYERKCIIEYGVIMSVPENKKKKGWGKWIQAQFSPDNSLDVR